MYIYSIFRCLHIHFFSVSSSLPYSSIPLILPPSLPPPPSSSLPPSLPPLLPLSSLSPSPTPLPLHQTATWRSTWLLFLCTARDTASESVARHDKNQRKEHSSWSLFQPLLLLSRCACVHVVCVCMLCVCVHVLCVCVLCVRVRVRVCLPACVCLHMYMYFIFLFFWLVFYVCAWLFVLACVSARVCVSACIHVCVCVCVLLLILGVRSTCRTVTVVCLVNYVLCIVISRTASPGAIVTTKWTVRDTYIEIDV